MSGQKKNPQYILQSDFSLLSLCVQCCSISVKEVITPGTSLGGGEGELTIHISDMSLSMSAKWKYKQKSWYRKYSPIVLQSYHTHDKKLLCMDKYIIINYYTKSYVCTMSFVCLGPK